MNKYDLERLRRTQAQSREANMDQRAKVAIEENRQSRKMQAGGDTTKPKPDAKPKPKRPGVLKRTGQALTKQRVAPKIVRPAAGMAVRGAATLARGALGLPGMVGTGIGLAANKGYLGEDVQEATEVGGSKAADLFDSARQLITGNSQQAEVDAATTETPEQQEYLRQLHAARQQGLPRPPKPGEKAPAAQGVTGSEAPLPDGQYQDSQAPEGPATELYLAENGSAPAGPEIGARNVRPIDGSNYDYAGQYGDTDVLVRPTTGPDGKVMYQDDGSGVVPEYSDVDTAAGFQRPGPSQEELAAEEARVEQARRDYARNTTGSDGRRYYGGSSSEALTAARQAAVDRGDTEAVDRSLAYEGLTPEQRKAYEADPSGAYATDANAKATAAQSQLSAFKSTQDMIRNANRDARSDRKESRQISSDARKLAESSLGYLEDSDPKIYSELLDIATQTYDASGGRETMPQVLKRVMAAFETTEDGYPAVDDAGNLIPKEQADEAQNVAAPYL